MDTINDKVFGEMTYDYSWEKYEVRNLFEDQIDVRIVAKAYEGQEILDIQRESYKKYMNNEELYIRKIPQIVLAYYKDIYDDILEFCYMPSKYNIENITADSVLDLIEVHTIYFDREGNFGYLCECGWDDDNGIAIMLSEDEPRIVEEDKLI